MHTVINIKITLSPEAQKEMAEGVKKNSAQIMAAVLKKMESPEAKEACDKRWERQKLLYRLTENIGGLRWARQGYMLQKGSDYFTGAIRKIIEIDGVKFYSQVSRGYAP